MQIAESKKNCEQILRIPLKLSLRADSQNLGQILRIHARIAESTHKALQTIEAIAVEVLYL